MNKKRFLELRNEVISGDVINPNYDTALAMKHFIYNMHPFGIYLYLIIEVNKLKGKVNW